MRGTRQHRSAATNRVGTRLLVPRRPSQVCAKVDWPGLPRVSRNDAQLAWIRPHIDQLVTLIDNELHESLTIANPVRAISHPDVLKRYEIESLVQRYLIDNDVVWHDRKAAKYLCNRAITILK